MKSSFALCSDDTLSHHCFGNLEEACNISTDHHVAGLAALDGSLEACLAGVVIAGIVFIIQKIETKKDTVRLS